MIKVNARRLALGLVLLVLSLVVGAQCLQLVNPTAPRPAAPAGASMTPGITHAPQRTAYAPRTISLGPTYLNANLGTEPPTADPALATDDVSVQVDELLFLGLTDYDDQTLEAVPELAEKWEVSSDGLKWTFTLRKDVNWVQYDPATGQTEVQRPVTAHDVEYAVKRTLDPATASNYAYVLYGIKGGQEFNTQTVTEPVSADTVGVKAVDDHTVEFELVTPAGYFPGIAGMWVCRPVPREVVEEHGDAWTEPGNVWTNGSYCLDAWQHYRKVVMVKNPRYPGAANVQIDRINWYIVTEASTALAMYENGELDVTAPPLAEMERIRGDPVLSRELCAAPVRCTYYYGFNTARPPMDNVHLRRALSYAVDRQSLCEAVLKGGQQPARTFACPGIFGSPAEDPSFPGIEFDPAVARQELALAGYPGGAGLPRLTLMFNTSEGHQQIAQAIQANWREHLGIEVELASQEWSVYLRTIREDAPHVYRLAWCADYLDEHNWVAEVFHSTRGANRIRWSNLEFDRLVEQAAFEADPARRKDLYFQAERILCVDEAGIVPIYYYTRMVLTKGYVTRTYAPLGGEHVDLWRVDRP